MIANYRLRLQAAEDVMLRWPRPVPDVRVRPSTRPVITRPVWECKNYKLKFNYPCVCVAHQPVRDKIVIERIIFILQGDQTRSIPCLMGPAVRKLAQFAKTNYLRPGKVFSIEISSSKKSILMSLQSRLLRHLVNHLWNHHEANFCVNTYRFNLMYFYSFDEKYFVLDDFQ